MIITIQTRTFMVTRDPLDAKREPLPRLAARLRAETHRHDEEASIVVILFVCVQKMDRSDGPCSLNLFSEPAAVRPPAGDAPRQTEKEGGAGPTRMNRHGAPPPPSPRVSYIRIC